MSVLDRKNSLEIQQYKHAIKRRVINTKHLFEELKSGIIILVDIQEQITMNKNQILELHKKMYYYWQSEEDGIWHTCLPEEGVDAPLGKKKQRKKQEKLDELIIDFYLEEEKAKKENEIKYPTFSEVYSMWREIKDLELSGNSIYKYNTDYKRFFEYTDFADTPVDQINENTIKRFVLEKIRDLELCKESTRKFYSYIKNTIRHARIEKIITDNPVEFIEVRDFTKHCEIIEKPDSERYYSDDEMAVIIKALEQRYKSMPIYMAPYAIELAIYTGMRVSELATLKWDDVSEGCINIYKSAKHDRLNNNFYVGKTKTKKSRVYPVDDLIANLFKRIKYVQEEYAISCEWIFTDGSGSYTAARNITDCLKRICRENRLSGGGITKLRKTASSELQRNGIPKAIVASMLGHTEEVNEKYYTYDTSNMDEKKAYVQSRNEKFKSLKQIG